MSTGYNVLICGSSEITIDHILAIQNIKKFNKIAIYSKNKEKCYQFSKKFNLKVVNSLTKDVVMSILDKECRELADNLMDVGNYILKITKGAKDIILEQGFDKKFGARPLRRSLERLIENPVAEMILKKDIEEGDIIKVTDTKGILTIKKG